MIFRKAQSREQTQILELYRQASNSVFSTWNADYPGLTEIGNDLAAGTLYVLAGRENPVGCISIVPENELDSLSCWTDTERVGEIARVAVSPACQGKRLGLRLVTEAEAELKRMGCRWVHLLVAVGNLPAFRTYQKAGYRICGEFHMYGNWYYACEKKL